MLKSLPRQDDSAPQTKPNTIFSKSPETNKGQTLVSTAVLEELSRFKQLKEALAIFEKELEIKSQDRKKRIQKFKSDTIAILFGSALVLGVATFFCRN